MAQTLNNALISLEYGPGAESSTGKSTVFSQTAASSPVGNFIRTFFVGNKDIGDFATKLRGAKKITIRVWAE